MAAHHYTDSGSAYFVDVDAQHTATGHKEVVDVNRKTAVYCYETTAPMSFENVRPTVSPQRALQDISSNAFMAGSCTRVWGKALLPHKRSA